MCEDVSCVEIISCKEELNEVVLFCLKIRFSRGLRIIQIFEREIYLQWVTPTSTAEEDRIWISIKELPRLEL